MNVLSLSTKKKVEFVDITDKIRDVVEKAKVKKGVIFLYVPHTTAGLAINENADPSVKKDIINKLSVLVPENEGYLHTEGNADAHIKSVLSGNQLFFFIEDGRLVLGTWQGIFFCEFDGPRDRKIYWKIV